MIQGAIVKTGSQSDSCNPLSNFDETTARRCNLGRVAVPCAMMVRTALLSLLSSPCAAFHVPFVAHSASLLKATPRAAAPLLTEGFATSQRRELLKKAAVIGGLSPLLDALPAFAADSRPVLVLGASGGTGRECVNYLLAKGRPCIAATRTGEFELEPSKLLTVAKGDVTNAENIASLITPGKLSAVIFAASASRQKDAKAVSNAKAVDQIGVVETAKQCIACENRRKLQLSRL